MKINEIKNILKIEKSTKWKVGSLKRSQIWTNLSYIEQEKWNRKLKLLKSEINETLLSPL